MGTIVKLDSVQDYNELLGVETLHPLVSVVDFSELESVRHCLKNFGFYCIFLKHLDCGPLLYGRNRYDYREGTLVFIAPGQVFGIDDGKILYGYKGWCLMFHPDLLRGTSLARRMADYSFFSYSSNEALHMSEREQQIIINCFREIREELQHAIDKHSKQIIAANIEVLLNHCVRFYDRQFVTRENVNKDLLTRFEELLRDYFTSDKPQSLGLPSVAWCADRLHLSANYYPADHHRPRQRAAGRRRQVSQRNRLRTGIQISAPSEPAVQKGGRLYAQRIQNPLGLRGFYFFRADTRREPARPVLLPAVKTGPDSRLPFTVFYCALRCSWARPVRRHGRSGGCRRDG